MNFAVALYNCIMFEWISRDRLAVIHMASKAKQTGHGGVHSISVSLAALNVLNTRYIEGIHILLCILHNNNIIM